MFSKTSNTDSIVLNGQIAIYIFFSLNDTNGGFLVFICLIWLLVNTFRNSELNEVS